MREDVINEIVDVLFKHDDAETALIAIARERGCTVSDLPKELKKDHDKYEYLSMDLRSQCTDEEYDEAINRYDS